MKEVKSIWSSVGFIVIVMFILTMVINYLIGFISFLDQYNYGFGEIASAIIVSGIYSIKFRNVMPSKLRLWTVGAFMGINFILAIVLFVVNTSFIEYGYSLLIGVGAIFGVMVIQGLIIYWLMGYVSKVGLEEGMKAEAKIVAKEKVK